MPPLRDVLPARTEMGNMTGYGYAQVSKPATVVAQTPKQEGQNEVSGISHEVVPEKSSKPQFCVKAKGVEGYVGSAWLNEGKYGKYISIKLHSAVGPSATLYVSPTKDNAEIL